jgi:hypothetical protein
VVAAYGIIDWGVCDRGGRSREEIKATTKHGDNDDDDDEYNTGA